MLIENEQLYGPISSHDHGFTKTSVAFAFNLESLVDIEVPKVLTLTKLDGIVAYGSWFTAVHIETGGDDSITTVPVGRKLMIIAQRGKPARRVESLMTSVKAVVNLLTKPPPKCFRNTVKFFFTSPDALLIQPALWAHTVVTFGNGPSLVVGFEGLMENDQKRRSQVVNYFSTGIEREKRTFLTRSLSDKAFLKSLTACKKEKTALFEHLECLQHDARPAEVIQSRNGFITKKNKRMLNLGRCRRRVEQKMFSKKG